MTPVDSANQQEQLISVLIPAWNEADRITACVASLLAADDLNLEILICAGGDDGTFAVASALAGPRVSVVEQLPGQGKQRALRELFAKARGDLIYLTDADCVVPADTLGQLHECLVSGGHDVVAGTYRPFDADMRVNLVAYKWAIQRADERRRGEWVEGFTGANVLLRREAIGRAGSFQDDVATGTDYHLARSLRAAEIRIRYVDAAVQTEYALEPKTYLRRQSRWLRNTLVLGWKFDDRPEVISTLQTIAMSSGIVLAPLVWPFAKWKVGAAWTVLFATMVRRRGSYIDALQAEQPAVTGMTSDAALPLFCLLDSLAGTIPLVDLARKASRQRW